MGENKGSNNKNKKVRYEFSKTETFINPYQFVPVGNRENTDCSQGRMASQENGNGQKGQTAGDKSVPGAALHTGVLTCRLVPKTPLIVPDTSNRKNENGNGEHFYYPFMTIDGKYVIPASSLRGPIRSVYEAATDSCFSTIRQDQVITARTKAAFLPGLLKKTENGEWVLYEAERYCVSKQDNQEFLDNSPYGAPVVFRWSAENIVNDIHLAEAGLLRGYTKGYLFKGEHFGKKKYESVFAKKQTEPIAVPPDIMKQAAARLKNVLLYYHDIAEDERKRKQLPGDFGCYMHIDEHIFDETEKYIPVWYKYEKRDEKRGKSEYLHLSFANIGRFAYSHSLNQILGGYQPCRNRTELCKACRLFGMAGEESMAGKIRFTDAVSENTGGFVHSTQSHRPEEAASTPVNPESLGRGMQSCRPAGAAAITESTDSPTARTEDLTLRELGTPHISYLPFYTEKGLDYDQNGVRIRGRKFYWHHKPQEGLDFIRDNKEKKLENVITDKENPNPNPIKKTNLNSTMEALEGCEFVFRVYYNDISTEQLEELKWVLCLGENRKDSNMCHKFGHGKPLGFGSAKIVIDRMDERKFSLSGEAGYRVSAFEGEEISITNLFDSTNLFGSASQNLKALRILLDFDAIQETQVCYPYVKADDQLANRNKNNLAAHQWFTKNWQLGNKPEHPLPNLEEAAVFAEPYKSVCFGAALPVLTGRNENAAGGWNANPIVEVSCKKRTEANRCVADSESISVQEEKLALPRLGAYNGEENGHNTGGARQNIAGSDLAVERDTRKRGTIKFVNRNGKYGYLVTREGDVYFELIGNETVFYSLRKGQSVTFESVKNEKTGKQKAVAIQKIK